jgi:hypothetical protein
MRLRPTRIAFGVSLALLVALNCLTANAQSGRRQAKPTPAAPVPTPTPEPTPSPTPKRNENAANFLVARGDRGVNWSGVPLTFYEAARNGCADRLRDKTSYAVDVSQREMRRADAIQRAKAGKTTYVVLIDLVEDQMSGARSSSYIQLELEYVVFAPGTAKVVATGRTYENTAARKGPISVGNPRGTSLPSYREAQLRRAGEDAADRILKSIHLSDPPITKSS